MTRAEVESLVEDLDNVRRAQAFGYTLFFVGEDHRLPFLTIADSDQDFDDASDLDRDGVFRINIGVGRVTFDVLLGDRGLEDADHRMRRRVDS